MDELLNTHRNFKVKSNFLESNLIDFNKPSDMPTQAFDDTDSVNMVAITTSRQNSRNEEIEHPDETVYLKMENENDLKKCKVTVERKGRKTSNCMIAVGVVLASLIVSGIIGWLTWLTLFTIDVKHSTKVDMPQKAAETELTDRDTDYKFLDKQQDISGVSMVLDVNSLFDKTTMTLRYQITKSKLNFSDDGVQYQADGSFKILKSGRYLIHSKLSLTNEDFKKSEFFQHCVVFGDNKSLECDQASVPAGNKQTSQLWRIEHLEQNQVMKIVMSNKDIVYQNPNYNKLEIVEYIQKT